MSNRESHNESQMAENIFGPEMRTTLSREGKQHGTAEFKCNLDF